ncbi:MAG: SAM-dependent methyltransferase [Desulfuromonas sp.]|uniref:class I SAM-dependent methyltransferase n=1 Tax=Desulfuromonas sp. TaxID=892 RepID=UPI000CACF13B|nr:methyltransferase domain-containing protein [Desulfuromonas sp.]PLX83656.1 MAG: SAM-dependent methyltransferase [Desulfuromonas sp.]
MKKEFKDRVKEQFGRSAEGYVRDRGFAGGEDLAYAAHLLQPTPEDHLLDVACGGGHTALYFAPMVRSVVASYLTMQMLNKAQEYIAEEGGVDNVTFREADAEDLPVPAGSFTLLTCRIAPHHFPDVPRALREFHRVLRRGGRMVIIDTLRPEDPEIADWSQEMEKMRDPTNVRSFSEKEWVDMVKEAGFDLHETKVFPKTHDFREWALRAGLNQKTSQELIRHFLEAPAKIQDHFHVETFAGEIESYTDQKLLIYATRPEKK